MRYFSSVEENMNKYDCHFVKSVNTCEIKNTVSAAVEAFIVSIVASNELLSCLLKTNDNKKRVSEAPCFQRIFTAREKVQHSNQV